MSPLLLFAAVVDGRCLCCSCLCVVWCVLMLVRCSLFDLLCLVVAVRWSVLFDVCCSLLDVMRVLLCLSLSGSG